MSIFHKMFMAASGAGVVAPTPELADPYFDNVELLLHGDGTSGSTTFTDSSPDPKTLTASGNAQIDTAIKKFGTGSIEFDGTGDYATVGSTSALNFGSGEWTVECWFYRTGGGNRTSQVVYNQSVTSAASNSAIYLGAGSDGMSLFLSTSGSSWTDYIVTSVEPTVNTWVHCVWQRRGNTLEIYLDGSLQTVTGGSSSFTGTIYNSSRSVEIGSQSAGSYLTGYIDDLRVTKGVARYTSDFNPPDVPHPDIGSDQYFYATELLVSGNGTNGSTTFTDQSSNALTITANGNAQVDTAVKKFGTGSIELDGTGDYLTVPDDAAWDFGSGDFTIESWVYPTASPAQPIIVGQWTSSYAWVLLLSNDGNRYLRALLYNGVFKDYVSTSALSLNSWNHCAFVREGNTVSLYLNGTSVYSTTFTGGVGSSTSAVSIGANAVGGSPFQGYLDDVRVTKGVARYTSDFTPPRIEHPDFGTTREAVPITVNGNAQISTAQSKFGGSSAYFDGTGDYLKLPYSDLINNFSNNDFTIECWIRPTRTGLGFGDYFFGDIASSGQNTTGTIQALFDSSNKFKTHIILNNTLNTITGTAKSLNNWYHYAIVRNGTDISMYINGTKEGTSLTTSTAVDTTTIGMAVGGPGDYAGLYFQGYIDEFRITKGVARYTSNFTAPTAAFDNDSNTAVLLHMDNPNSSTTFIDDNGLLTSTE